MTLNFLYFEADVKGKLANVIWGEDRDVVFFGQFNQDVICHLVIHDM
jgi:hypothetical protein